jgi:uncharacterized membrane protein
MSRTILMRLSLLLIATAALAWGGLRVVFAQSGTYDLSWNSVDSGGGTSSASNYSLSGTIGQADAGAMSGGNYSLAGGFWGGGVANPFIYLPLIQR